MPQVRVEKNAHYTTVENDLIQNSGISLKAKGLLIYMLSVPDDWDYSISGLSVKCKEGKSAIRGAISELIEHGYVTRSLARNDDGTIGGYEYVVFERPQPSCDFPTTDNPSSENRTQQINNLTKEEKANTPYSPPTGDGAPPADASPEDKPARKPRRTRRDKSAPAHDPEAFEVFWANYPRKDDRKAAIRAWDKLKPDKPLCRTMYTALKRQRGSEQWAEAGGKYIPLFSTWLNGRKWENQGVDLSLLQGAQGSGGWAPDPEHSGSSWADAPD